MAEVHEGAAAERALGHEKRLTEPRAHPAWVFAGVALGVALFWVLADWQGDFSGEDVGLGRNTVAYREDFDGKRINGPFSDLQLVADSFAELRAEGRDVALWLGASQTYAINHPEPGDHLAVWYANARAQERGSNLFYLLSSSPNANLHELLCSYLALRQRGLVPDVLVLGFTYDDLKEPGIRGAALEMLDPPGEEELAIGGEGVRHVREAFEQRDGVAADSKAPVERTATAGTPQERLEDALVAELEDVWPVYRKRGALRAAGITAWKMPVTTLAFRVFSRPQTAVPRDMQAWNEAALESLIAFVKHDGVALFVYKAPHRPGEVPFFHPRKAYDAYQAQLRARCEAEGFGYVDLETIVPAEYWGITNNWSPDVFHFQDEGHARLGRAVDQWLEEAGR